MSRKRRGGQPKKKKSGGVMSGLRGGFKSAVKGATGVGEEKKPSKRTNLLWNVVTVILAVAAGAMLLRRCGVINFGF